jgi:hypothetical protein
LHKELTQKIVTEAAAPRGILVGGRKPCGLFSVALSLGGRCNETVSSRLVAAISFNRYYMFSPLVCSGKVGDLHKGGWFLVYG